MATRLEDIKSGTAQARLSETEGDAVRVGYKHGTPLEAGKIADSKPVDLFSSAHKVAESRSDTASPPAQSQQRGSGGGGTGTDGASATEDENT